MRSPVSDGTLGHSRVIEALKAEGDEGNPAATKEISTTGAQKIEKALDTADIVREAVLRQQP